MIISYLLNLKSPYKDDLSVWSFVSNDGTRVLVQGVGLCKRRGIPPKVKLRGLHPNIKYKNSEKGQVYTGVTLMEGGIHIPYIKEDNQGFQMEFIQETKVL